MSAPSQTVAGTSVRMGFIPWPFRLSLGDLWFLLVRVEDLGLTGPDAATDGMHSRLAALGVPTDTPLFKLPEVLACLDGVTLRIRPDGEPCEHDWVGNFTGREARRILQRYLDPWGLTLDADGNVKRTSAG